MSPQATALLNVQGLSAHFGEVPVLHHLDLACRAGQWLAVVGPNGAGKSTLLRCMAGLMAPSQGQVLLGDSPVLQWPAQARARQLSWLSQQVQDDTPMTVYDTVALGRLPHQGWLGLGACTTADTEAIERALADTDMSASAGRPLNALSGGERQRVWLARALAVQAPVLLLDEPNAHLDAPHQRLLATVLRREAAQGRAVISVLHDLSLALAADRLAVMSQGRLVAVGLRDDPLVHRAIEHVFEQALAVVQVQDRWIAVPQL